MSLPTPSPAAVEALAPTGTLRAAINLSNFLLVTGKGADGNPEGVSPDMARTLADQLGVGIELLRYKTPADIADSGDAGLWDVGNIGAEPARAKTIPFTAAYCEIEATYMVPPGSDITSIDQSRTANRPDRDHVLVAPDHLVCGADPFTPDQRSVTSIEAVNRSVIAARVDPAV